MKTKHTPGPWVEDVDTHDEEGPLKEPVPNGYILGANGVPIAKVYGMANAHLIAAAPEMLSLLKSLSHDQVKDWLRERGPCETQCTYCAAIAKAEGK